MPGDPWTTEQRLSCLVELIESSGFRVLYGDFVRKDGTRIPYHLHPFDSAKLAKATAASFGPE
jgi:hypothetical protein